MVEFASMEGQAAGCGGNLAVAAVNAFAPTNTGCGAIHYFFVHRAIAIATIVPCTEVAHGCIGTNLARKMSGAWGPTGGDCSFFKRIFVGTVPARRNVTPHDVGADLSHSIGEKVNMQQLSSAGKSLKFF